MTEFESATFASQKRHSIQAELHPVISYYVYTLYQQKERLSTPSHKEKERMGLPQEFPLNETFY